MDNNTQKDIISIISDVSGFDAAEITPETNLPKDLEMDSIKAIEVAVAVEKKYKVRIKDEDIPSITTVRQLVELVNTLSAQKT